MGQKLIVSINRSQSTDKRDALKADLAEQFGVTAEDVVILPDGVTVTVLDVPDAKKGKPADAPKKGELAAEAKPAEAAPTSSALPLPEPAAPHARSSSGSRGHTRD